VFVELRRRDCVSSARGPTPTETPAGFAINNHNEMLFGLYIAGFAKNQRIQPYQTSRIQRWLNKGEGFVYLVLEGCQHNR
jgi:hypothetical protein